MFLKIKNYFQNRSEIENLILHSQLNFDFLLMCVLSGLIAAIGIILRETAVLIAAMVLAPLLNPILSLAAGVALFHKKLFFYALKNFFFGFFSIIFFVAIFTKILIFFDFQIDFFYFFKKFADHKIIFLFSFLSFLSGIAAVFLWLHPKNFFSENLVGVAIAVSLVPFVSFFGILLAAEKFDKLSELFFLFTTNLLALIFGAILTFFLAGISKIKKSQIDREIEN